MNFQPPEEDDPRDDYDRFMESMTSMTIKPWRARVAEQELPFSFRQLMQDEINELRDVLGALRRQEPYGSVAIYHNDNTRFYKWPDPPYLDNALDCKTVYLAAGAKP